MSDAANYRNMHPQHYSLKITTFILLCFLSLQCVAQTSDDADNELNAIDHSSHAELGIDAANKLISAGRDYGIHGVVFAPTILYKHHSGLYTYLTPNIWTDTAILKQTKLPDTEFGFGLKKSIGEIVDLDFSYSHEFLTYGNAPSRKLFDNTLSLESEFYLGNIANAGADFYLSFSRSKNKKAHELLATYIELYVKKELSFYNVLTSKRITITPGVNTNLGSDNMVNARKDQTIKNGGVATNTNSFWGLLDIEGSAELEWRIDHLSLYITPSYILPFNLNVNDRNNQAGKGLFYINGGFTYYLFKRE